MRKKSWTVSVAGIVIVGVAAALTPWLGLSSYGQTIPLFVLFTLFVVAMNVLELVQRAAIKRRNRNRSSSQSGSSSSNRNTDRSRKGSRDRK